MSFNRLNYDTETYKHDINQSVGPGNYHINPPPISCKPCYPESEKIRLQRAGASIKGDMFMVDVDSELSGLFRKNSNNPNTKYKPCCDGSDCPIEQSRRNIGESSNSKILKEGQMSGDENLTHFQDCGIHTEDTRLNNPPCTLRSSGWNRWEWLCHNPQDQIEIPFETNINYRMIVKDNHRPIIPNLINQDAAYPIQKPLPCEPTNITCASFTQPSSLNRHSTSY
jgi:hypothetical protein